MAIATIYLIVFLFCLIPYTRMHYQVWWGPNTQNNGYGIKVDSMGAHLLSALAGFGYALIWPLTMLGLWIIRTAFHNTYMPQDVDPETGVSLGE